MYLSPRRRVGKERNHSAANVWQTHRKLLPVVAVVSREPQIPATQSGVDVPRRVRIGEQAVGHVRQRIGQPAAEFFPLAAARAVDMRFGAAGGVRMARTGRDRDVPQIGLLYIGGDGPSVMTVQTAPGVTPRPP